MTNSVSRQVLTDIHFWIPVIVLIVGIAVLLVIP
ncbi:MAG: translocated intimin receptor Tir [Acidobacteria bacterium]|nr:MAG: translocated intimin receptor Tir [Acidobacteriota bacterium]